MDEIAALDRALQAKLFEAIARRGASGARVFCATKHDLDPIGGGPLQTFRAAHLMVPPLRARLRDEIEPLARGFVRAACEENGAPAETSISAPALAVLRHHVWPRNVRELKEVVGRAVLLASDVITLAHLPCHELAPVVSIRRVG